MVVILGLVPLVLLLEGCGGGGGDKGAACNNEKMMLVTQSIDMKGSFELQMPMPNATENQKTSMGLGLCEKIDMEKMIWFVKEEVSMEMPDPERPTDPFKKVTMTMSMMLDVGAQKAAFGMKALGFPGAPENLQNCTWAKLPFLGEPAVVSKCVKDAFEKEGLSPPQVPGLAIEGPACARDENGYDKWVIKFQNETTVAPGVSEMMDVEESFTLDKNYMFRELAMNIKMGKVATMYGSIKTEGEPKAVGPSEEDLNHDNWGFGACKEMPLPGPPSMTPQMEQLHLALSSRPGASALPMLQQVMKASKAAEGRRLQGGGSGAMPSIPGGLPEWTKCFMPTGPPPSSVVV